MHRALAQYENLESSNEALVAQHRKLIDRIARKVAWRVGDPALIQELWGVGAMGLIEAAGRFDPSRSVRFEAFAEHRIRGAMIDELRRMDRLPRRLRARSDKILKARAKLTQTLGRDPDEEEIARVVDMSAQEVTEIESVGRPQLSLDLIPLAVDQASPEDVALQIDRIEQTTRAIARLPERLQILLSLHYVEGLTYREVAGIFEVSEPRICQLHKEAVKRLRTLLEPEN